MKLDNVKLDNLTVVPEEMVVFCADQCRDDENNTFKRFLIYGHEFRLAGLTPVYLCDEYLKDIIVTTEENLKKEYN